LDVGFSLFLGMSVAIYTKNKKQLNRWQEILKSELPEKKVEIYPDISDFTSIDFLICWKPYSGLVEKFPNLKAIQSLGAGVDHIFDTNEIDPVIQVSKIVDHQLTHDMWEHVLSIVLADMKNLALYQKQQTTYLWKPKRYRRFKDTTIGILGLGTIGSYVARQFAQLGFKVAGWSGSKKEIANVETHVGQSGLDMVCNESDFLINILPLTNATSGILNKELFSKMKPSSYLINVGRGAHVVDEDLVASLRDGEIRGAALDVFHMEPLPVNHDFWNNTQILVTPHIASLTHIDSVYPQVVENIRRLDAGRVLLNTIDVEKGY